VIIRDLNIVSIPIPPQKTQAELIVDPNAVLAQTVMAESFVINVNR
jgi:hypothetical protein